MTNTPTPRDLKVYDLWRIIVDTLPSITWPDAEKAAAAIVDDEYAIVRLIQATFPTGELPWYADHANLVTLTRYMADIGASAGDIAYAVEKPWKHEDDWRDALAAAKAEAAS